LLFAMGLILYVVYQMLMDGMLMAKRSC
jgi:hypothetical protein